MKDQRLGLHSINRGLIVGSLCVLQLIGSLAYGSNRTKPVRTNLVPMERRGPGNRDHVIVTRGDTVTRQHEVSNVLGFGAGTAMGLPGIRPLTKKSPTWEKDVDLAAEMVIPPSSVWRLGVVGGMVVPNGAAPAEPFPLHLDIHELGSDGKVRTWQGWKGGLERLETVCETGCTIAAASDPNSSLHVSTEQFASAITPGEFRGRTQIKNTSDQATKVVAGAGYIAPEGNLFSAPYAKGGLPSEHTTMGRSPTGRITLPGGQEAFAMSRMGIREAPELLDRMAAQEGAMWPFKADLVRNAPEHHSAHVKVVKYSIMTADGKVRDVKGEDIDLAAERGPNTLLHEQVFTLHPGETLIVEQAAIAKAGKSDPMAEAIKLADAIATKSFAVAKQEHERGARRQWQNGNVSVFGGRDAREINDTLAYNRRLLGTAFSEFNAIVANDLGAKGDFAGRYRDHKFWEMFILSWLRSAMQTHDGARGLAELWRGSFGLAKEYAQRMGFSGALYEWQTNANGEPDTQPVKENPTSHKMDVDWSIYQRHNNWALVYGVMQLYRITGDRQLLKDFMPILIGAARLAQGLATPGADGRYHTEGLMGPDEYHERLPGSIRPDLPDSFYNNFMIAWVAKEVNSALRDLKPNELRAVLTTYNEAGGETLSESELASHQQAWSDMSNKMFLPVTGEAKQVAVLDPGGTAVGETEVPARYLEQFVGMSDLHPIDWSTMPGYLERYNQVPGRAKVGEYPRATGKPDGTPRRADQLMRALDMSYGMADVITNDQVKNGKWTVADVGSGRREVRAIEDNRVVWTLDRDTGKVLDAEGKVVTWGPEYNQVSKQGDSGAQLLVNFSAAEMLGMMHALGYDYSLEDLAKSNVFADSVTTGGSTLGPVAGAAAALETAGAGQAVSEADIYRFFRTVLETHRGDEGGEGSRGLTTGAMAAGEFMLFKVLGFQPRRDLNTLTFNPRIPREVGGIKIENFQFGANHLVTVRADGLKGEMKVTITGPEETFAIKVGNQRYQLKSSAKGRGTTITVPIPKSSGGRKLLHGPRAAGASVG